MAVDDLPAAPVSLRQLVDSVEAVLVESPLSFGHGTEDPRDEAAWLVLAALGRDPVAPVAEPDEPVDAAGIAAVDRLLHDRVTTRQPLAYLTGRAWFAGLEFITDARALVPRSPLAEPICDRFSPWLADGPVARILDIGTGGGCIAIACAHAFPEAVIDATDVSEEALSLARENIALHALEQRVHLYQADVYDGLPPARYRLIVSNPPYVDAERMAALPDEYRHEPEGALAAGRDGLNVVNRIIQGAAERLTDDGLLVVEVGGAAEALERAWPRLPFTWLEFEHGGHGVFVLAASDLVDAACSQRE